MAEITLTFTFTDSYYHGDTFQLSAQVGDIAHYVNPTPTGDFVIGQQSDLVTIGVIKSISATDALNWNVVCEIGNSTVLPTSGTSFILFSKDNRVNMSSLLGYYGSAKFKNNSTAKAEMFTTSCEIDESSK